MRLRKLQHEGVISKLERKLNVKQRLVAVGANSKDTTIGHRSTGRIAYLN